MKLWMMVLLSLCVVGAVHASAFVTVEDRVSLQWGSQVVNASQIRSVMNESFFPCFAQLHRVSVEYRPPRDLKKDRLIEVYPGGSVVVFAKDMSAKDFVLGLSGVCGDFENDHRYYNVVLRQRRYHKK